MPIELHPGCVSFRRLHAWRSSSNSLWFVSIIILLCTSVSSTLTPGVANQMDPVTVSAKSLPPNLVLCPNYLHPTAPAASSRRQMDHIISNHRDTARSTRGRHSSSSSQHEFYRPLPYERKQQRRQLRDQDPCQVPAPPPLNTSSFRPLPSTDPVVVSLMDFYTQSGGTTWSCATPPTPGPNYPWGTYSATVCEWIGVTCDNNGYVIGITLPDCRVQGFVDNMFSALTNLTFIDLSYNCLWSVDGSFYQFSYLPKLTYLTLASQWNLIASLTDDFFKSVPNLIYLSLSSTAASGSLSQFATIPGLQCLDLSSNAITGNFADLYPLSATLSDLLLDSAQMIRQPMPSWEGFTQLKQLNLGSTALYGTLPSLELPNLQALFLDFTNLEGTIPILNNQNLNFLTISSTFFTGGLDGLYNLSNLQTLDVTNTPVDVNLTSLASRFPILQNLFIQAPNSLVGSLVDLENCPNLRSLSVIEAGLTGEVPNLNLPLLNTLELSSNYLTSLPTFSNSPELSALTMRSNRLVGTVPCLPRLQQLDLGENMLSGNLPTFLSPTGELPFALNTIFLDSNAFIGSIPEVYAQFPSLRSLALGMNLLNHTLPAWNGTNVFPLLEFLILNDNYLFGPLPTWNMPVLLVINLVNNQLQGPLDLSRLVAPILMEVRVDSNQFTCPITLPPSPTIQFMSISSNRFNSTCELDDWSFLMNMTSLTTFDGSYNEWGGSLPLFLPQQIKTFSCQTCALQTAIPATWLQYSTLTNLFLSNNTIFGSLHTTPTFVVNLDMSFCGLEGNIFSPFDFYQVPVQQPGGFIQSLDVSHNNITGTLARTIFDRNVPGFNFLGYVQEFRAAHNQLVGKIPEVTPGWSIEVLDLSYNNLAGTIPESIVNFAQLRELRLESNPLLQAPPGRPLPSFITYDTTGVTTSTSIGAGWSCPALKLISNPSAVVTIDPSYYNHSLCSCVDRYFGQANQCQLCPAVDQCACNGKIISNCFPVPIPPALDPTTGAIEPDSPLYVFLPCPLTILGQSLCNPNQIEWDFTSGGNANNAGQLDSTRQMMNERPRASYSSTGHQHGSSRRGPTTSRFISSPSTFSLSSGSTTSWCFSGHQGRVCSQCQDNYFASGRWCLQCLSNGYHILIFLLSGLLFLILVIFLYHRAPKVERLIEVEKEIPLPRRPSATEPPHTPATSSSTPVGGSSVESSLSPSTAPSASFDTDLSSEHMVLLSTLASSTDLNSWKLLVFHCQSLGILLLTQTSLPSVLVTFISIVSSGTGFSMSSLVAVECVTEWKLTQQLKSSLIAPVVILGIVAILWLIERMLTRRAHEQLDEDAPSELSSIPSSASSSPSPSNRLELPSASLLRIWKCHSVCLSLLYILVFPSAQLALSSLSCTDTRQSGSTYLNLYSWIECDQQWQDQIFPSALFGVLFWVVLFPVASTLSLMHLNTRFFHKKEIAVWPVLGEFFAPYHRQYWYWEQIILLRRLGLVLILAFVPGYSVYFPLLLFTLIQLTVLLQHQCHPYRQVWNHRAELASLYLLLVNYFTALVLHQSQSSTIGSDTIGTSELSVNGWAILLLIANVAFILILLTSFSLKLRRLLVRLWALRPGSTSVADPFETNDRPREDVDENELVSDGAVSSNPSDSLTTPFLINSSNNSGSSVSSRFSSTNSVDILPTGQDHSIHIPLAKRYGATNEK